MRTTCEHNAFELCKACREKDPYMVYTPEGYRFGPGAGPKNGQFPYWQTPPERPESKEIQSTIDEVLKK